MQTVNKQEIHQKTGLIMFSYDSVSHTHTHTHTHSLSFLEKEMCSGYWWRTYASRMSQSLPPLMDKNDF